MSKTFFTACDRGNVSKVQAAINEGVDPNCRDEYQLTGLIRAARKGRGDVVELLLNNGAEIDTGDVRGRTALFHAVCFNHVPLVDQLAEQGADVNPVDSHGWTPLDMARSQRNDDIESLLERFGGIANSHPKVDVPDRFTIGVQFGGPNVGHIADLKRELFDTLNRRCDSLECDTVDEIGICLRVNGPISQFGDECIDRVRHMTKQRYVSADVVIPESVLAFSQPETRDYLADWVGTAIDKCIERLDKKRLLQNSEALRDSVTLALNEFSNNAP